MTTNGFQGFTAPNQHTQTPNEFFEIILDSKTTMKEIKILAFMIRNTFGWHRAGSSLQMSLTDIQKMTGMHRETVSTGLQVCVEKSYLQKKEIKGAFYYRLNILEFQDIPWKQTFDWKSRNQDFLFKIQKSDDWSENPTSRKIRPEVVGKSDQRWSENPTSKKPESFGAVEAKPPLKKGLKKDLKKEEEEEIITQEHIIKMTGQIILKREITNPKTLTAIWEVAFKCKAIGTNDHEAMQNYLITIIEDKMKKFGQKQKQDKPKQTYNKKQPLRKEIIPDWFDENQQQQEPNVDSEELKAKKKAIEEKLKAFRQ